MVSLEKDPNPDAVGKCSDKAHKSLSILSVVAVLLTVALFVRIETVNTKTETLDTRLTKRIQHIEETLNKLTAFQTKTGYTKHAVRRSLNTNTENSLDLDAVRAEVKRYVSSLIVGSLCQAPGKVCVAGPPGQKGNRGSRGKRGPKGTKGTQGFMGSAGGPGKQGIKGDLGDAGEKGEKGDSGPPGLRGPKGDPGDSISAPVVMVSPESRVVAQNQTASFFCSADGNPPPNVSWEKINGLLDKGLVTSDGQGSKLVIKGSVDNDSGQYTCTARNVLGRDQKVVRLFVEVAPQLTETPARLVRADEGSNVSVACKAFGYPPPIIQWSRAFVQLPRERATVKNGTLVITNLTALDAGLYQCKAINKVGSVTSLTTLNVGARRGWKDYTPMWCTQNGRKQLSSQVARSEDCKTMCLERNPKCSAIEWWENGGTFCFECTDPSKRASYTNTKDTAYPPHVYIKEEDAN